MGALDCLRAQLRGRLTAARDDERLDPKLLFDRLALIVEPSDAPFHAMRLHRLKKFR